MSLLGGCGLIPQTRLLSAGGPKSASGPIALVLVALFLALAATVGKPVVGLIPLAGISGVMVRLGFRTIEFGVVSRIVERRGVDNKNTNNKWTGPRAWNVAVLAATAAACYEVDFLVGIALGVLMDGVGRKVLFKGPGSENEWREEDRAVGGGH